MVSATVLIPTHNHAETLYHAVASVQAQTLQDFEVFIVGDGATEETRRCIAEMAKAEARIRFFDFPKGPRKGEIHRHTALTEAAGRFVAYLGDDDLWLPDHLAILDQLLSDADFGHTLHVGLDKQGSLFAYAADLECPEFREKMLTSLYNRFDFTFGGHTLEAYRRLPNGWHSTPPDYPWSDLYMWRQFLAEPWCRARSVMIPTGICTQTHLRPHLTNRERADELAYWQSESIKPDFREMLWRKVIATFARDVIRYETATRSSLSCLWELAEHSRIRKKLEARITSLKSQFERATAEANCQLAEHSRIRQKLEARITSLKSQFERATAEANRQLAEHSRIRQKLEARITSLKSQIAKLKIRLADTRDTLRDLRRSRLLKLGRLLRRLTGRSIPY